MFTFEEKPWSATDTLPWPPDHLRPYIKMDGTQDWEIVDDSIPDDLRKEFEEWHDKYVDIVHKLTEQFQENFEKRRIEEPYRRAWHERVEAMWKHEKIKFINFDFKYCYPIGVILSEKRLEDMNFEELKEYVNIVNVSHKKWLEVVKKQESIPVYLTEDFNEKNLELARKKYGFIDSVSFDTIMECVENEIEAVNSYYHEQLALRKNDNE
jgi:hypothetical protein